MEAGSKEFGHLPLTELSCSHYKCQFDTLVALRDQNDLEVKEKKPRLEGVAKVLWILEEELGEAKREWR